MDETIEFWEDLDPKPENPKFPVHRKAFLNTSPLKLNQFQTTKSEEINFLENSLASHYSAHQQEYESIQASERKATIETVQHALNTLQSELYIQVSQAKQENEKMVKEIQLQSSSLNIISEYLSDFEFLIFQNRLPPLKHPSPTYSQIKKFDQVQTELTRDLNKIKITIQGIKDGIRKYRQQSESTNQKLSDLKQYLSNCQVKFDQESKDFEASSIEQLRRAKEENVQIRREFEEIKQNKLVELECIEKKCNSNSGVIESLKFELKSVKEVLNYPVLKLRVHNKLQEYLGDHNLTYKPPSVKKQARTIQKIRPLSISQELEFNCRSSVEEFSPHVSKLNLSSRKTSSTGTRTKLCKSIQMFNSYEVTNHNNN